MDMKQIVKGVVLTKTCSIKPDKDSSDKKTINLKVKFDEVELGSVFAKALSGAVIQWQNGPGRSKFDPWVDKQTVEISFSAPGQVQVDPKAAIIAEATAAGIDVKDKVAFQKFLSEKFGI